MAQAARRAEVLAIQRQGQPVDELARFVTNKHGECLSIAAFGGSPNRATSGQSPRLEREQASKSAHSRPCDQ